MVETIRDAAVEQLRRTSWMSASTRAAAIHKLKKMNIQVGWPDMDTWTSPEELDGLSRTDLIGNILRLNAVAQRENVHLLMNGTGCRSPLGRRWERPVFEVNAFYYPDENRFLLPAGILRPPFYDTKKSVAWNYGAIGATIGHELCHAFDSDGRMYDEKGDKRDWWTERDDREYKHRAARVVALYSSTPYRGMEVDGKLTLVENIADLGGLEFALAGLRSVVGRTVTKDELREFFTAYTVSWRAKDRLKRAAELLLVDPHAPPMLRVNHTLRQFDDWYAAFDISPECEGYVPPEKRIRFFS
jgi:predicted metalloendopeptidase